MKGEKVLDSGIARCGFECNLENLLFYNLHSELESRYKKVEYLALEPNDIILIVYFCKN